MPAYMYKIQPVRPEMLSAGPIADEARIAGEHFEYLRQLGVDGILILAGRTLNTDYSSFGLPSLKRGTMITCVKSQRRTRA